MAGTAVIGQASKVLQFVEAPLHVVALGIERGVERWVRRRLPTFKLVKRGTLKER